MKQRWAVLILLLAGIIAYANTAKNGLFWDDDEFITKNAYIRSFRYLPQWFSQPMTAGAGVNSNYYRPLLQLSFAIDYKLWGLWPAGYHIENSVWHSFAGILLFIFLNNFLPQIFNFQFSCPQSLRDSVCRRAIFNQFSKSKQLTINNQQLTIIAFTTALLWLVHPAHVEAVAYANSRGDSMAAAFILLTLILWIKQRFRASAIAFILALLSKEFAIVTPGLIILLEFMKHQIPNPKSQTISKSQSQNSKQVRQSGSLRNFQSYIDDKRSSLIYITNLASKKLYRLLTIVVNLYNSIKPAFLHITIAIIYLTLRLTVLNFQNTLNFYGVNLARADSNDPTVLYAASLPARLMTFLKVLPIYGRILVWPNDLHMERTVEIPSSISDPTVFIPLVVIISLLITSYFLLIRKSRIPAFALGWLFISILPVSGVIPISQILAEHFLYLPSIGFFLLLAFFITLILSTVLTILFQKTRNTQNAGKSDTPGKPEYPIRRSDSPVFRLSGSQSFQSVLNEKSLSIALTLFIGFPLIAKTISQNRVWRDPITFYEYTLTHAQPTARVYNNLGMAYADAGNHQKAINNYQLAINMGDVYPNPHYNLGNTLIEMGRIEEAEREYKQSLEIDPNFHYATLKLGQIYLDQGKIDAAKNLVCPVFPTQPLCR